MPNIRLTVNGTQEFDGDPGEWVNRPPDVFRDALKPGPNHPWMQAVLVAFTHAVQSDQSVIIDVMHRSNRWSVGVEAV